ncbi:MAG: cysteine desulfurase [Deltaproteobacteria bacterium]|nr:cysteine desulfurase [Deltaproteobacteria bacterium]
MSEIYLDNNASAPLDPEVREAMLPYLGDVFGNSRSAHPRGTRIKAAIEHARAQVAALWGCDPGEVIFTSGGSEANNLSIKGLAFRATQRKHLVMSAVEHLAVSAAVRFLQRLGFSSTTVPVDGQARIDAAAFSAALRDDTLLVCIQHANNEVGTVQDVAALAARAHTRGALVHCDAAQSVGKLPVRVSELGADLCALAAHKFCGPQGIGALYVKRGLELEPLVHGAGHEHGLRSGTHPAALIVGLGRACELALQRQADDAARMTLLRDRLFEKLRGEVPSVVLNGHPTLRLPNTLNVSFPGVLGYELVEKLEGVAASTGAACHAGSPEMSLTLKAMGAKPDVGLGAIRLSLSRLTTEAEVDEAARRIGHAVRLSRPPAAP